MHKVATVLLHLLTFSLSTTLRKPSDSLACILPDRVDAQAWPVSCLPNRADSHFKGPHTLDCVASTVLQHGFAYIQVKIPTRLLTWLVHEHHHWLSYRDVACALVAQAGSHAQCRIGLPRSCWASSTALRAANDITSGGQAPCGHCNPMWSFRPAQVILLLSHRRVCRKNTKLPDHMLAVGTGHRQESFDHLLQRTRGALHCPACRSARIQAAVKRLWLTLAHRAHALIPLPMHSDEGSSVYRSVLHEQGK